MKKGGIIIRQLVRAGDIEKLIQNKETVLHIDEDMIVTPSARDLIRIHNIQIMNKKQCCQEEKKEQSGRELSREAVYRVVRTILEQCDK